MCQIPVFREYMYIIQWRVLLFFKLCYDVGQVKVCFIETHSPSMKVW
jgi:hypothetical protein